MDALTVHRLHFAFTATAIVVYCQGGGRSAVAADVLTKMGYTNVSSLAGGLAAYQAAGLPVDTSSPPK